MIKHKKELAKVVVPETIYTPQNHMMGFGDRWATVNWLLHRKKSGIVRVNFRYVNDQIKEIASLLDSKVKIIATNQSPNKYIHPNICYFASFRTNFFPTKIKWRGNQNKIVSYQFDGIAAADEKNFKPHEEKWLLANLHKLGYKTINVGGMRPMHQCVSDLARSEFFVGVPSGLGVMARSVGVPSHIVYNNMKWMQVVVNNYPKSKLHKTCYDFIKYIKQKGRIKML